MRILLIDDEYTVTDNLSLYLRRRLHTVEALSWVQDGEHLRQFLDRFQPHAVVLDYGMEPLGSEIYSWIREWKKVIPIVFYTSYARNPEYRKEMINCGATEQEIVEKREVGSDLRTLLSGLSIGEDRGSV